MPEKTPTFLRPGRGLLAAALWTVVVWASVAPSAANFELWTVVNQDGGLMPLSGGFNIEGFASAAAALPKVSVPITQLGTHVVTASNTTGDLTRIDRFGLNGSPYSFVFATLETGGASNPHPISVAYDFFEQRWAIFNLDAAPLPLNAEFTITYAPVLFFDGFESGDFTGWSSTTP